jgi:hypothetical protein
MLNLVKNQRVIISSIVLLFAVMPSYGASSNLKGLDPTKPLLGSTKSMVVKMTDNIVLEGIFHGSHGEQTHTAVINGKALKVNDYIGDYRLVAVNDNNVVLRSSEKRLKLSLFSSIVKK